MDSCNSGSLQSSSGGDEEYDSRAGTDSVSAFLTGGQISDPPPQPPLLFDHLPNFMQLHQNPTVAWSKTSALPSPRSDPNNPTPHDTINPVLYSSPAFMPSFHAPPPFGSGHALPPPPQNQNQAAASNPKKRSRASRRAPTTVLTTDTSNFRAMVQEFTGIPSSPFSNSPFQRARLDLLGTRSTSLDGAANPPPYLRRPFAQKGQSPLPFLGSPSSLLGSTAAIDAASAASSTDNIPSVSPSTASANFQLPIAQTSNLHNINPNPLFTPLLRTNPKFPFSNASPTGSKSEGGSFGIMPSNDDQFALGHGIPTSVSATLNCLPNLFPSNQNCTDDSNNAVRWRNNPDVEKANRRPDNGGFNFTMNGKTGDFSGSSSTSNFHGEKGPENVAGARGEGMVESWICSSE